MVPRNKSGLDLRGDQQRTHKSAPRDREPVFVHLTQKGSNVVEGKNFYYTLCSFPQILFPHCSQSRGSGSAETDSIKKKVE